MHVTESRLLWDHRQAENGGDLCFQSHFRNWPLILISLRPWACRELKQAQYLLLGPWRYTQAPARWHSRKRGLHGLSPRLGVCISGKAESFPAGWPACSRSNLQQDFCQHSTDAMSFNCMWSTTEWKWVRLETPRLSLPECGTYHRDTSTCVHHLGFSIDHGHQGQCSFWVQFILS